jgi:mannosyltransferase
VVFFLLTFRSNFTPRHWYGFIIAGTLTIIGFIPWLYRVLSSSGVSADPILAAPTSIDFFNVFSRFLFGFQIDPVNSIILSLWPLLFVLLIISIRPRKPISPETAFFIVAALLPLLVAFTASYIIKPVFLSRYLVVSLVPLYILITQSMLAFKPAIRQQLITVTTCALVVATFVQLTHPDTPVKEDFASVALTLEAEATPQDIILLSAPFMVYPINYYYEGVARVDTLPDWDRFRGEGLSAAVNNSTIAADVAQFSDNKQRIFVVVGYDQGYEADVRNYFKANHTQIDQIRFSNDLQLLVYSAVPDRRDT